VVVKVGGVLFGDNYTRSGVNDAVTTVCRQEPQCNMVESIMSMPNEKYPGITFVIHKTSKAVY
jgi:hypothetical protein